MEAVDACAPGEPPGSAAATLPARHPTPATIAARAIRLRRGVRGAGSASAVMVALRAGVIEVRTRVGHRRSRRPTRAVGQTVAAVRRRRTCIAPAINSAAPATARIAIRPVSVPLLPLLPLLVPAAAPAACDATMAADWLTAPSCGSATYGNVWPKATSFASTPSPAASAGTS